jgi:hypothetical protein
MPNRMLWLPIGAMMLAGAPVRAQVAWETSLAAAQQKAAAAKKPVLVAVWQFDGKGAEEMLAELQAKDPAKALGETVNVFVDLQLARDKPSKRKPTRLPPALDRSDVAALDKLVELPDKRFLQGPQWIVLSPEGKPLAAAPGRLVRGEIEWLIVQGVRKLRPDFAWQASDGWRAPRHAVFDKVATSDGSDRPDSDEDVASTIEELKKSRRPGRDFAKLAALVRTSNPDAIDYVTTLTRASQYGQRLTLLGIAQYSPREWTDLVLELLERGSDGARPGGNPPNQPADPQGGDPQGGDPGQKGGRGGRGAAGAFTGGGNVRTVAGDALEELANPKAMPALKKAWAAEKVEETQGAILRAMAASAPDDKAVAALIDKTQKAKSDPLRAQATLAAGLLAQREAVTGALVHGLQDRSPLVRGAAAYTIAWRRDRALDEALTRAVTDEKDGDTKALLEAATEALKNGPLDAFDDVVRSKLGRRTVADETPAAGGARGGKGNGKGDAKGNGKGGEGGG